MGNQCQKRHRALLFAGIYVRVLYLSGLNTEYVLFMSRSGTELTAGRGGALFTASLPFLVAGFFPILILDESPFVEPLRYGASHCSIDKANVFRDTIRIEIGEWRAFFALGSCQRP